MHDDELSIDEELARHLMSRQFPGKRKHAPR